MRRCFSRPQRTGKVLALVSLLLPVLFGLIGLIIDAGALFAAKRQGQNAADAAARTVAMKRLAGESTASATTAAEEVVRTHHRLPGAIVEVNAPPTLGAYAGDAAYSEVIVTVPVRTWFIQALSGSTNPMATARAVAGSELVAPKEVICALDPDAVPGLTADGVMLSVGGRVWANSQGAGLDESGAPVNVGVAGPAARLMNGGVVRADRFRVVGGVDTPAGYRTGSGGACLRASELLLSDPFLHLATPTTANGVTAVYPGADGQNHATPQDVAVALNSGDSVTLSPGIYSSIEITGGPGTVTFQPGIYVLRGGNAGRALNLSTTATVTASGVLFYNTGSNYDPATGLPDRNDGNQLGTDSGATFGSVTIDAGELTLSPPTGSGNAFAGFAIYQRRWNRSAVTVKRNAAGDAISGSVYARWAPVTLVGVGTFNMQVAVGSFTASGASGTVAVNTPTTPGKSRAVNLVE